MNVMKRATMKTFVLSLLLLLTFSATWLAARLFAMRAEQPGLFLAAGDMIQGDTWTNFSQGHSTIALLNALRLELANLTK